MHSRSFFVRYRVYHLLVWLAVAIVWFYLRYQDYSTIQKAVKVTIVKTIDLALMVYVANYLLIPVFLYKRRYVWFVLSFFAMIVTSSLYKMYLLGKITGNPALLNWSGNIKSRIYDNVIPHIFLVIAGVAIKLVFDYIRIQKRLTEVAKEKAEAELNFLKSQINPHFLFNSLNSVYFLIDKSNTEARKALHTFSDMLRYQLYEVRDEKIPIEKELGYLKDYIALQKLRNENCSVQLEVQPDMKSFLIEPLLLIPLVENSFKHLSHYGTGRKNEIEIGLSRQNGEMDFAVRNTTESRGPGREGGIGLKNVQRRLELLYPYKHQFRFSETEGWFDVRLKIKIER